MPTIPFSRLSRKWKRDPAFRKAYDALAPEFEELRRLVREGIDSGSGLDADAVFARLQARFGRREADTK
jgi:hypothetical protein